MKLDYSEYKHISFDLWLTLIKSNPEFKNRRNLLFKDFFELTCSIERVAQTIRHYDLLCNSINEKTGLNIDTFEIYYLILGALDVNIELFTTDRLDEFYRETEMLFMEFKPDLIYPKIQLLLKQIIDQGKTLSVLSNTAFIKGVTLRKLLSHYQLEDYFSFQVYSDETGVSKPNDKIFQIVYDNTQNLRLLRKKDILHVGDNKVADYAGAVKFGFDALLIKI